MKLLDLWAQAERCITSFESLPANACITEDEHVRDFLKPLEHSNKIAPEEAQFIRETTYGVLRQRGFLDATLQGYCTARKKNRQNAMSIMMLYYFVLFRFDELGPSMVRQLLYKTLSSNRIAEMLELLLDTEALRQFVVPKWTKVVDDFYVENQILGTISRIRADLTEVAAYFRQKASGTSSDNRSSIAGGGLGAAGGDDGVSSQDSPSKLQHGGGGSSTARGFKLFSFLERDADPNRVRKAPLPPYEIRVLDGVGEREQFPKIAVKCTEGERNCIALTKKGVRGASTLDPSVREANRAKERSIAFREFTGTSRPAQLPKLLAEAQRRDEEAMRPVTTGADPYAVGDKLRRIRDEVDIKMTQAALRREHQLYQARLEEEEQARLRKEREMRDDSEFVAWKRRMEEAEEAERLEMVARRKAELVAGDMAARAARVNRETRNLRATAIEKAAMNEWRREAQEQSEARRRELAANAQALKEELKKRTEHAVDSVAIQRRTVAAEVRDENMRLEQSVAIQLELETQRKQELIEEIKRAHAAFVELQQRQRATLAERVANGALNGQLMSMTIAELRNKLVETRAEQAAWEEEQRNKITQAKAAAANEHGSRVEFVEAQRQQLREAREAKRLAKLAAAEAKALAQQKREETLAIELQAKLDAQRAAKKAEDDERKRLERQRKVAAQLLSADAGMMEANKWAEMERGRSNAVVGTQNRNLQERKRSAALDASVTRNRLDNIAAREEAMRARLQAKDEAFQTKRTIANAERDLDDDIRTAATKRMREQAKSLRVSALASAM